MIATSVTRRLGEKVAKVKKAGAVRTGKTKVARKTVRAPFGARGATRKTPVTRGKRPRKSAPPAAVYRVRALDPQKKCGLGTSVQRLYRVNEESADGEVRPHLVFFDKHGWYCEHGRDCPAVRHAKQLGDRARQRGLNHNGGMRA
jgi:hypothetical protein